MPDTVTVPGTLSGHAREIWRSAFLSSYGGTCKGRSDRDGCSASIAWAAVKDKYRKNADGEWVTKAIDAVGGPVATADAGQYPQPLSGQERSPEWRAAFNAALLGECAGAAEPEVCAMEAANRVERDSKFASEGMVKMSRLTTPSLIERATASGLIARKDYSPEKRAELAAKGWAMPDGSFPIEDKGDLMDAIHSFGRAGGNDEAVKTFIRKRAKELGALDEVSSEWGGKADQPKEEKSLASLSGLAQVRALEEAEDKALLEAGMGGHIARRPEHINSNDWMARPLAERTIGRLAVERAIERSYEDAVEGSIAAGWHAIPNPSRKGEIVFQRWIDTPDGMLLQRSVLVRRTGTVDWRLRELTRGASLSLAVQIPPGERRFGDPRV